MAGTEVKTQELETIPIARKGFKSSSRFSELQLPKEVCNRGVNTFLCNELDIDSTPTRP